MITTAAFLALAIECAPDVAPDTLSRVVKTESSFNPWAIGVVGKALKRQPSSKEEALEAIKNLTLNNSDVNFSVGLAQINRQYFDLKNVEAIFEPCTNLKMGSNILKECYIRALKESDSKNSALLKSFSCYYSGNNKRGFVKESNGTSYVDRIVNSNSSSIKVPSLVDDDSKENNRLRSNQTYGEWDVLQQYPKYRPPVQRREESDTEQIQDLTKEEGNHEKS